MKLKRTTGVIEQFGNETVRIGRRNLKVTGFGGQKRGRKKESSGALGKGLGYVIYEERGNITIQFTSQEDYAGIVEEGRKPNSKMPPVDEILRWTKVKPVKLRVVRTNASGQKTSAFRKETPQARRQAAFAIAKSIGKKGVKGVPFFSEAMNEAFEKLPDELQTALVADLEDLLYEDFTKQGFNVSRT